MDVPPLSQQQKEITTLGGGCFWCIEAVFDLLKGVETVESGYMGGKHSNPSYENICTGMTGHAEVVQVTFNPSAIPYQDILHIFFSIHDPTTFSIIHPNRKRLRKRLSSLSPWISSLTLLLSQKFPLFKLFIWLRTITKSIMCAIHSNPIALI